ncbi:hypothetical protein CPB86DRAFT_825813 [Serendipita vermifera]|nr:hypothetical protein CPB86DRAFT_825813 [Serendipita vermifera]
MSGKLAIQRRACASGYNTRPIVACAAPKVSRELLNSSHWYGKNGELAIKAVQLQLDTYYKNVETSAKTAPPLTNLFDAAAQRIATLLEEDPDNLDPVLETINPAIAWAAWSWPSIPYPALCSIWRKVFRDRIFDTKAKDEVTKHTPDVDRLVIHNEDWLRLRLQDAKFNWKTGLVTLENCEDVFFTSKLFPTFRQIERNAVDGWKCLDAKRSSSIFIQPNTEMFKKAFEEMTLGQLKGLEWPNIFVAGGIVVGSLLRVEEESSQASEKLKEQWKSSDIDIYIYGLDPLQANEKIKHLFTVFKNNLPEDAPILVVRNSKTISFISNFPRRRFQIILKIVKNPAEVLLNFDLDICAMGFDGENVYMLPRAARALESESMGHSMASELIHVAGYNVFTMDMVQGHYLGTRRATQEQRVFKYASKGYGIRVLPSYLEALNQYEKSLMAEGDNQEASNSRKTPYIEYKTSRAKRYFDRIFATYMSWSNEGEDLLPTYTDSYSGPPVKPIPRKDKPVFTHALLDTLEQDSSEPLRRSCLTGFELFYRHVCLWDAEQEGKLDIYDNVWASTTYDENYYRVSYEELPCYAWDESFSVKEFEERVLNYNTRISDDLEVGNAVDPAKLEVTTRKIIVGPSLEAVMQQNLSIPIWLPEDFLIFARDMMKKISNDLVHLPFDECFVEKSSLAVSQDVPEKLVLVEFNLSPVTMFQQIDRRLDELFEAVWSFMYSNYIFKATHEERTMLLRRQLSRRALRRKSEDEYGDFIEWIKRDPGGISGYNYGAMGQGFWEEVAPRFYSDEHSEYDLGSGSDEE